jgi:hypothetical protein
MYCFLQWKEQEKVKMYLAQITVYFLKYFMYCTVKSSGILHRVDW